MSSDPQHDSQYSLGRDRARLINERLMQLFNVRSKCERARSLDGEVPTEHQIGLHNAIRDVYLAIRPLRDENAISEWWESVKLSRRWGEWQPAKSDHEDSVPIGQNEDGEMLYGVWQPYQGLDALDQLRDVVRHREERIRIFGGFKTKTTSEPHPLPYDVLLDISMTLEDACERLGFVPEVRESTPRTEITDEVIEEVKEWQRNNL